MIKVHCVGGCAKQIAQPLPPYPPVYVPTAR